MDGQTMQASKPEDCGDLGGHPLLAACHTVAAPLAERRARVTAALDAVDGHGTEEIRRTVRKHRRQLEQLSPAITFIGQVKAGKTSLVNAMVGWPGLLPADVNPWTSVVTSLHLRPVPERDRPRARFTFFDREDWDKLTRSGGRVGELAGRAGAEDEAEKIRAQVAEMRAKSEARLGRKFEMLLGQSHDYGTVDRDLIARYVCLGDAFDDDPETEHQGRFADITRSAELMLDRPAWPVGMTIRDTPGVNDTFMMREQITIRAIRESRLCVVVLSAHQALTSVDMAIIRLISNVRAREVILFVNRIDELSDPAAQIPEIRDSIRTTLAKHQGPTDAQIVFGSAAWATASLEGTLPDLPQSSSNALVGLARERIAETGDDSETPEQLVWALSGVPALYNALWARIAEGPAQETLQQVARGALNLGTGLRVSRNEAIADADDSDIAAIARDLNEIERMARTALVAAFDDHAAQFSSRIERSHRSFLDRATSALIHHLETFGELAPWSYDPTGLRLLLRSGYQVFARNVRTMAEEHYERAAAAVTATYASRLDQPEEDVAVAPPTVPRLQPPVLLGQTIALDLQTTWWRRWWQRRRGYAAFAPDFAKMIAAETQPILHGLETTHCAVARAEFAATLEEFFEDQRTILKGIANHDGRGSDARLTSDAERLDATLHAIADLAA